MRVEGKVVLITGASEGIGAACAAAFLARGARVSLTARSEEKLRSAAGAEGVYTPGDITDPDTRARVVARTVERFGRIDILINNAGRGLYRHTWEVPLEDARALFELNLMSLVGMTQLVVPHMRAQGGGTIVNVSSIAGKMPLPWFTLYSASKYAVCALTDGLRMELKPFGIHTMTVCPGYVNTGFQEHSIGGRPPERVLKGKRFAVTAHEVAHAVVRGVERGARTVMIPAAGWILIALARLFPGFVDARVGEIGT